MYCDLGQQLPRQPNRTVNQIHSAKPSVRAVQTSPGGSFFTYRSLAKCLKLLLQSSDYLKPAGNINFSDSSDPKALELAVRTCSNKSGLKSGPEIHRLYLNAVMKFLSVKESLAIVEIIVGSLCFYNFSLTDLYDEKLLDLTLFKHRCLNVSLGFVCFFNAFGTWFWFSNIRITKMLNRLHKVVVYLVSNILLISTHFSYKRNYIGPLVWGYFDQNIFFDEIERINMSFKIVLLILTLSLILIGFNLNFIRFRVKHLLKKRNRSAV